MRRGALAALLLALAAAAAGAQTGLGTGAATGTGTGMGMGAGTGAHTERQTPAHADPHTDPDTDLDTGTRTGTGPIRPHARNAFYWEYRGAPVLLLGASVVDNLHHWPEVEAHLDAMQAAGVNYLRVSLSRGTRAAHGGDDRPLPHDQPFLQGPDGRFDLTRWDPVYWTRLDRLLTQARARGMIVELELFNRFDFWRDFWETSAWNPARNVTYTEAETGLAPRYAAHPSEDLNPFFHSVPDLADNPALLARQRAYVDRVLDLTLGFDNILYTINNETTTDPAWGRHWIAHVRARAAARGREVHVSDMFDAHDLQGDAFQRGLAAEAGVYGFASVAQVTSMRNGATEQQAHLAWLRQAMAAAPRPVTLSKLYGADAHALTDFRRRTFRRHGDTAAIHSFWMSLMGGASAIRFHRATAGLGPSDRALASIRAARLMEGLATPWEMAPADHLLTGVAPVTIAAHETALGRAFDLPGAHAMADPGRAYAVFFTRGGAATLAVDTTRTGSFDFRWIDVDTGTQAARGTLTLGVPRVTLAPPGPGAWLAVLTRARAAPGRDGAP
jgi:hypothetical protein